MLINQLDQNPSFAKKELENFDMNAIVNECLKISRRFLDLELNCVLYALYPVVKQEQHKKSSMFQETLARAQMLSKLQRNNSEDHGKIKLVALKHIKDYVKSTWQEIVTLNNCVKQDRSETSRESSIRTQRKMRSIRPRSKNFSVDFMANTSRLDPLQQQLKERKENQHKVVERINVDKEREENKKRRVEREQMQVETKLSQFDNKSITTVCKI